MHLLTSQKIDKLKHLNKKDKLNLIRDLLVEKITSRSMGIMLELLLDAMSLLFILKRDFRKNINNFKAKYVFIIKDEAINVSAIFKPSRLFGSGRMRVQSKAVDDPDVAVSFENGKSMADFLFSENPDFINGMLDNQLSFTGNLNYILKFAYMARRIPRVLGIQLQV